MTSFTVYVVYIIKKITNRASDYEKSHRPTECPSVYTVVTHPYIYGHDLVVYRESVELYNQCDRGRTAYV